MSRVLFFALIFGLVVWWLYGRGTRLRNGRGTATKALDDMVPCAHCGVHLPRSDAVADGALHYCGSAHRALGQRKS